MGGVKRGHTIENKSWQNMTRGTYADPKVLLPAHFSSSFQAPSPPLLSLQSLNQVGRLVVAFYSHTNVKTRVKATIFLSGIILRKNLTTSWHLLTLCWDRRSWKYLWNRKRILNGQVVKSQWTCLCGQKALEVRSWIAQICLKPRIYIASRLLSCYL